jgi:acetyltransferase-like isoleucine patch superfamily enzyme
MVKGLVQKLLIKSGKTYQVDTRIPNGLFYNMLINRAVMLTRGFLKTGQKVFIGSNTKVLNSSNIQFGKSVTIGSNCEIDGYASEKIILGHCAKIGSYSKVISTSHFSKFGKGLKIGNHSAFGSFTEFGAGGGIEIGDNVIAGSYISFHSENHNFSDTTKLIREQGVTSKGIKIGNNVWIGAKVTILDGTIIGDNCVIAAGAVLNSTYPKDCIIGGVPGKIIKSIE